MRAMDRLEYAADDEKQSRWGKSVCQPLKRLSSSTIFLFFFLLLLTSAFFYWVDLSSISKAPSVRPVSTPRAEFQLNCSPDAIAQKCPTKHIPIFKPRNTSAAACPDYFRWIHEDLRPWKSTGISRETIEKVKEFAHFRLVIVNGKAYLEKFKNAYQTRDLFNLWGFLQLLRLYPGKVPDLELMFQCEDRPLVLKKDGSNAAPPPPVFQYCGKEDALGIIFPDWSFWGWGGLNIRPWKNLIEDLKEGNNKTKWEDRIPYAYWKGNHYVSPNRRDLMRCRSSWLQDYNARLYKQDWVKEIDGGFQHSQLKDQCTHRYKIYIEGRGWSVSEKYIMACDSMALFVKPDYYSFFDRSLLPMEHYWPISRNNKCRDIKFAVDWGNSHPDKAQAIGKAGSRFIAESVKMENVYDYMFHSLTEYSKLLKFKPEIPKGAVELCAEEMACAQWGVWKEFMMESMVRQPSDTPPCTMDSSLESQQATQEFLERKNVLYNQFQRWQNEIDFLESYRNSILFR